jgi:hypothetical protein
MFHVDCTSSGALVNFKFPASVVVQFMCKLLTQRGTDFPGFAKALLSFPY